MSTGDLAVTAGALAAQGEQLGWWCATAGALAFAALRLLYLWRPIRPVRDEKVYVDYCAGIEASRNADPNPSRRLYFALGRLAIKARAVLPGNWGPAISGNGYAGPGGRYAALAGLSTLASIVTIVTAAALGGPVAALLVASSATAILIGRRGGPDALSLLAQMLVLLAPAPLLLPALTLMLLIKESSRTAFLGLATWIYLQHGPEWLWTIPASFAAWALLLGPRRCWRWHRRAWDGPDSDYGDRYQRGGWLRTLVDLCWAAPVPLLATVWAHHPFGAVALALVAGYGLPYLNQQHRTAVIGEIVLRLAAAQVLPWWGVLLCVGLDCWTFWRIGWVGRVYDTALEPVAARLFGRPGAAQLPFVDPLSAPGRAPPKFEPYRRWRAAQLKLPV